MGQIQYIKEHFVDEETILTLGTFTVLWAQFELEYCDKFASPSKIHDLMKEYHPNTKLCSLYVDIKTKALEYIGKYNKDTIAKRVYSTTNGGRPQYIARIKCFLETSDLDFDGCMLFIERIRNNLLHGEKDIYTLPEQKDMFDAINTLLNEILINRI